MATHGNLRKVNGASARINDSAVSSSEMLNLRVFPSAHRYPPTLSSMPSPIRVVAVASLCGWAFALSGAEKLQYNRDIRPILSDRCFKCHGPDKGSRKATLRLDIAEEAYAPRKKSGKHAIVPGKPDQSLVCQKIVSNDPDDLMPPPESKLSLTATEKEKLRRWIAQGA